VTRVGEMTRIEEADGYIYVGAAVTHTAIVASPLLTQIATCLVESCGVIGGPQVRNVATLGGNVANASPAGDGLAALWALDARVEALTPGGWLARGIEAVVVGPGRLALPPACVLTAFRVAARVPGEGSGFYKLVNRAQPEHPMAIAVASVVARLRLDGAGRVGLVRLVLGAVAPTPVRAAEAERLLAGELPTPDRVEAAARAVAAASRPIDDVRASAEYRRAVLPALARAALAAALAAAAEPAGG